MSRINELIVEYIEGEDSISYRAFARGLRAYLDSDLDEESFFQRHYGLLRGARGNMKPEEEKAYESWLAMELDPHGVGAAANRLKGVDKQLRELRKSVRSGQINRQWAEKTLKRMASDVEELLSKINMPVGAESPSGGPG